MHKLERPAPPACLTSYRHGVDIWSDTSTVRNQIWEKLEVMQGNLCAYCESDLSSRGKHIEHFNPKRRHLQLTFAWTNLFGSCEATDSCGHHKDSPKTHHYNIEDIIKPDEENPEEHFIFISDGTISIRHADSYSTEYFRASETLRVFNLGAKSLRWMRHNACMSYVKIGNEVLDIIEQETLENRENKISLYKEYLKEEFISTRHLPFATAIKHTLFPKELHLTL